MYFSIITVKYDLVTNFKHEQYTRVFFLEVPDLFNDRLRYTAVSENENDTPAIPEEYKSDH